MTVGLDLSRSWIYLRRILRCGWDDHAQVASTHSEAYRHSSIVTHRTWSAQPSSPSSSFSSCSRCTSSPIRPINSASRCVDVPRRLRPVVKTRDGTMTKRVGVAPDVVVIDVVSESEPTGRGSLAQRDGTKSGRIGTAPAGYSRWRQNDHVGEALARHSTACSTRGKDHTRHRRA
jgi:hypothetical protein